MNKPITIYVNTRPKEVEDKKITFEQVVVLEYGAYDTNPQVSYTVTYSKGNNDNEGEMDKGSSVTVKKGMRFIVTKTDKS